MAFFHQLTQDIHQTCLCPDQGIAIDTEILSDLICSNEANPVYVVG
jgi:hypothetical protein